MNSSTATTEVAVNPISTQQLRQLLESKRPIQFWNVLTDEWFKEENIAGSRRVPLDKVGSEVRDTNLPKNTEIVVYCAARSVRKPDGGGKAWSKLGYENVRAYEGGLEEWKLAGWQWRGHNVQLRVQPSNRQSSIMGQQDRGPGGGPLSIFIGWVAVG